LKALKTRQKSSDIWAISETPFFFADRFVGDGFDRRLCAVEVGNTTLSSFVRALVMLLKRLDGISQIK
jgi:hypothetical protein